MNQHIFKVESLIDRDFHLWLHREVLDDLRRQTHGSGMVHIKRGAFLGTQIWLPPRREQARIVEAIEQLFAGIDEGQGSLDQAHRTLEMHRAATLEHTCLGRFLQPDRLTGAGPDGLPSLPNDWEWEAIAELAADEVRAITDGPFGSNLKTSHYTDSGPRVIRLQNIGEGEFLDERAHISQAHFDRLRAHEAKPSDVVVASLGDTLPRACLVQTISDLRLSRPTARAYV